jgi:hypothetical protein
MKGLWLLGALALIASGCKSEPYCLNCKDSGNGVIAPPDLAPGPDLAGIGAVDFSLPPDMVNPNGGCTPTNGGVEICDGLDNDCNGLVDDVPPAKLAADPNNCGKCGNECSFPNAFGNCGGTPPACSIGACQPGHIDLDGNPANGCEYTCTPSADPKEICDGKDNNCDGQVDEGFTKSWSDTAHQLPLYDDDINNCGQCAVVCSLGAGTVMSCDADATNAGRGKCDVKACFNDLDSSGTHQTYRHNMAKGAIAVTGCEYHCPKPATTTGNDCNLAGSCVFPAETCNGIDDDCDFLADDNLSDPGLNGRCPDGAPGKQCSDSPAPGNCQGLCSAGTLKCVNGGLTCQSSVGPSPESCDGKDNDCDGKIDNGYTNTWASDGTPHYDGSASNCGGCGTVCSLPNATNGCQLLSGAAVGTCKVVSCNPGWFFVSHKDSSTTTPTCNVTVTGSENSTTTTPGLGCNYNCTSSPTSPEICDGKDNDCDGCIDNGLTGPSLCSNQGVCKGLALQTKCVGAAGYKCDYSGVPNISLDGSGNLATTELQCDNLDNNCNGPCDENFTGVVVSTSGCTNPRAAATCKAGSGVCQTSGPITCQKSSAGLAYNDIQACSATADNTKASDELCNGKDDDCNGLIDEPTTATVGATTFQGWHDPTVQIAVGLDPFTAQPAHTVYVYQYEASRPDATGVSPGAQSTRACSNAGTLPWSNVTPAQAQAACAGIKNTSGNSIGRLCSAWELTQTCNANATSGTHYSMSANNTTYAAGVCNDSKETDQRCSADAQCLSSKCDYTTTTPTCPTHGCNATGQCTCGGDGDCNAGFTCAGGICTGSGAWPTGVAGTSSAAGSNFCYSTVGGAQSHDLSGNLMEWTSTPIVLKSGTAATTAAGPPGQLTIGGLANIYSTDVGAQLVLSGATNAGNNGTFTIVSYVSQTSVVISNAAGVTGGSGISWQVIYVKQRGGAYSTLTSAQSSTGLSCEFDFDIQKASYANTDVGFRCCSDTKP